MTTTAASHPDQPIKLYRMNISGHAHRVELFLSLLGLPFELINIDLTTGTHKKPEFLALNPFGQLPVIQDGDITLADSNAILVYLATRYAAPSASWLPKDALGAAHVQRWLSVAAGLLAFGPAAARVIQLFKRPDNPEVPIARAHALFSVMEQQLGQSMFLVGNAPTLADIANYSYIARAPEGNVSLVAYPNLRAWLARIEALPGFVPMVSSPVGLAA
ncbi:MAG TPA: glutathione S-transferase [Polaromonas sp.]|uniref:glutathione S-transferase family protein n=1 Tax=Polaromonas sp. TaxID=1869339 RepID=UPI002D6E5127|nr:glutathione S-transferase [Polaromonas sp.]HYW55333.1 glutathione S-transferase [Polaromonas sp.]